MRYHIFNLTDGVFAAPGTFTQAQAQKFILKFRARFPDGYRTAKGSLITAEEIILELRPV